MTRTRLRIRRKKALKVLDKRFKSLVKLIKNFQTPENAFDLNRQRDKFASWRAGVREQLLNVLDDESAIHIGAPLGIYRSISSLQDEGDRLFREMWSDHSELRMLKARVIHMPRVPWYERILSGLRTFALLAIGRYASGLIFLIVLIIILIILAMLAPEAFARVVHELKLLQGQ